MGDGRRRNRKIVRKGDEIFSWALHVIPEDHPFYRRLIRERPRCGRMRFATTSRCWNWPEFENMDPYEREWVKTELGGLNPKGTWVNIPREPLEIHRQAEADVYCFYMAARSGKRSDLASLWEQLPPNRPIYNPHKALMQRTAAFMQFRMDLQYRPSGKMVRQLIARCKHAVKTWEEILDLDGESRFTYEDLVAAIEEELRKDAPFAEQVPK